jgi:hypothetical protein
MTATGTVVPYPWQAATHVATRPRCPAPPVTGVDEIIPPHEGARVWTNVS